MDPLTGSVQHYAWGSTTALPAFLGVEPDGRPQAELWLGAHPSAPSRVGDRSLADRDRRRRRRRRRRGGGRGVRAAAAVPAEGAGRRPAALPAGPSLPGRRRGRVRARGAGRHRPGRSDPALPRRLAEAGDAGRARRRRGAVRVPGAGRDVRAVRPARGAGGDGAGGAAAGRRAGPAGRGVRAGARTGRGRAGGGRPGRHGGRRADRGRRCGGDAELAPVRPDRGRAGRALSRATPACWPRC